MKNLILSLNLLITLLILFLFESCSPDSPFEDSSSIDSKREISKYNGNIIPSNLSNPYDSIGRRIYNELLDNFKEPQYKLANPELLNSAIINNHRNVSDIINNSEISPNAKTSFTSFMTSLLNLVSEKKNYETIYNFIIEYETSILGDCSLTKKDKEIILKSSSAARYTTYTYATDPPVKDPDWKILITSLVITDKVEILMTSFDTSVEFHP